MGAGVAGWAVAELETVGSGATAGGSGAMVGELTGAVVARGAAVGEATPTGWRLAVACGWCS